MAKTRNKTHSEVESMRGYVRQLEAEIRSLQKQLRQFQKYEQSSQDEDYSRNEEDTHVELKFKKLCTDCGKNYMIQTLDLGAKGIYGECVCGFKGKMK